MRGKDGLPDEQDKTAEMLRKTAKTVLGVTFGKRKRDKETWWWNEEVQKSIKETKEAKALDKIRDENTVLKRSTKKKKSKAKKAVAMAKGRAYEDLYARLEIKEDEKKLYRLPRQRNRTGKDNGNVRVIKDENGNVMVNSKAVLNR